MRISVRFSCNPFGFPSPLYEGVLFTFRFFVVCNFLTLDRDYFRLPVFDLDFRLTAPVQDRFDCLYRFLR